MAESEYLKERFLSNYGLTDKTFDEMAVESDTIAKKFKYLDNFLFTNQKGSEAQRKYISNLFYMLNVVIERKLAADPSGKTYDLDTLNVHQFIKDYEGIMAAVYDESGAERQRPPYAGTEAYVLQMAEARMREYSKPLSELWAERIKFGIIDITKMREITDSKHSEIMESAYGYKNYIAKMEEQENAEDNENGIGEDDRENSYNIIADDTISENSMESERSVIIGDHRENNNNLIDTNNDLDDSLEHIADNNEKAAMENAIIMHEALKTVVARRTIGTYLWPGNWRQISRENSYLEQLQAQIEDYKKIDPEIVTKTFSKYELAMTTAYESLKKAKEDAIARSAQRKAERQQDKEKPTENKDVIKENINVIDTVTKEDKKAVDPQQQAKSQIQKVFHINHDDADNLVDFAKDRIEIIKGKIDAKKAYPVDYATFTFNTFNDAYELLKDDYGLDNKEAIIKAQSMTNVILNAYAKDVFPKANFEDLTNNYVVRNDFTLQMGLGGSFSGNVSKLLEEVKAEYSKEKIDLDLDEKTNKDVSSPVIEEKKPDVRSLNN